MQLAALILCAVVASTAPAEDQEAAVAAAYRRALRRHGRTHEKTVAAAERLVAFHYRSGRFADAAPLYASILQHHERAFGADSPEVATAASNLANVYDELGRTDEALRLHRRALEIRLAALGDGHEDVATSLNSVGTILSNRGQLDEAIRHFERAREIWADTLGDGHSRVAAAVNNIGVAWLRKGDPARAAVEFRRAAEIWREAGDTANVASALTNAASTLHKLGDYEASEATLLEARAALEESDPPEVRRIAQIDVNLAIITQEQGAHARALVYARRGLRLLERVVPGGEDVAGALHVLGVIYDEQGSLERAEDNLVRSLALHESLDSDPSRLARVLSDLGNLRARQGDLHGSDELHRRALTIREKRIGSEHPDIALTLSSLASNQSARGRFVEARNLYERALAIREAALAADHPLIRNNLLHLGIVATRQGTYDDAAAFLRRAEASVQLRRGSIEWTQLAAALSELHWAKGEVQAAIDLERAAARIEERELSRVLTTGSEQRKLDYVASLDAGLYRRVSLHLHGRPADEDAADLAISMILSRKARVQDALADSAASMRRNLDGAQQRILDELSSTRSRLAAAARQGAMADVPRLEARAAELEAQLGEQSPSFAAEVEPLSPQRVQAALARDEVLIELLRYRRFDPSPGPSPDRLREHRYAAYVLTPTDLQWVDLGPAAPIDDAVAAFRAELATPAGDPGGPGRRLDELLMRPLRGMVGATSSVIVAPDGPLQLVPFAALVDENGRHLIESIRFTYLTSGRDLVRLAVPSPRRRGVVVFADPEFGKAVSNGAVFERLPGTRREADVIRDAFGEPTRIFAGIRATEAALKQLEPPEVLHVATHGFFVRDEGVAGAAGERGVKLVASGESAEVDGLLRSGLALADANAARGEGDDGILTALEAGGLDLSGTQLVVLSACETGVGEATSGRGVQGLRRALVIAGSRTQVMSLWRLHDDAAVAMMRLYYGGLLAGEGRGEALRSAQRQLAKGGDYAHPYYWSGFIVSGESGPLRGSADTAPPAVDGGCGTCRSSPERDGAAARILLLLALARCRRRSSTRRPGSA